MANDSKLTECIPTHLTLSSATAVKNIAISEDLLPSQWIRKLVDAEINRRRLQAQATLRALGELENDENGENANDSEF
ncbi:hypothetical protein ACTXMF_12240 [Psychrobacter celer]|uniref:hypothetical protein n=1 Tax=Psychrobacter celer TaxID=306572 RepID=UPI003FD1D1F5